MLEHVQKIIHEEFAIPVEKITPQAHLRDDLHIDSMAAVNLSFEIEETFDIKINDEELVGLNTVSDIVTLLSSKNLSLIKE